MSDIQSLPLSHAQKGIWLGQQKLAGNPCYNTGELLCFEGEINIANFMSAVATVLEQTAALNMVFRHGKNRLEQCYQPARRSDSEIDSTTYSVASNAITSVEVTDSDHIAAAAPQDIPLHTQIIRFNDELTYRQWLNYWLAAEIDLGQHRPFRHAVLQRENGQYAWFIQIHHIACDGFSYALLSKQIKQAYETREHLNYAAHTKTIGRALDDYASLIQTACDYEGSDQCQTDRCYWQQQFKNHHPYSLKASSLSESQPAIAIREHLSLAPTFLFTLKKHAEAIQNDWPSLLKAYVAQWFRQAAGQNTITFGCPEMNRPFGPAMRLPALQMNILPLTVHVQDDQPALNIARQIQEQLRLNKAHMRYRYEHFTGDIKDIHQGLPKGPRPFGPIINILPFDRSLTFNGTKISIEPLAAGPVEDIAIYFSLADTGELHGFIEFHPELYKSDECRWLSQNFGRWLNEVMQLTPADADDRFLSKAQVPAQFAQKQAKQTIELAPLVQSSLKTPTDCTTATLFEQLEYQRLNFGQKCALSWFDETLDEPAWQSINYQTLCTYIADTAQTFAQAGLRSGQKCIVASGRGPWSIISMFACLALNAEFIGVDIDGPSQRLQTIIQDAEPRLVLVNEVYWLTEKDITLPTFTSVLTIEHIERLAVRSKIQTAAAMAVFIQNSAPTLAAYSIYTSGSTGTPKAVQVSQQALTDFVASANQIYQISIEDHVLQFAPLHFDACIEEIFISLCSGATLSIRSKAMVESFSAFNEALNSLEITFLDLPTAFWHEWVKYNSDQHLAPAASISRVIIGGEACKSSAIADFFATEHQAHLINTYGPSEATVVATTKILNKNNWQQAHSATIGKPLPGRQVFILDDKCNPLPKGACGQLALAGQSLANGYFGQPALTAEKFISLTINGEVTSVYLTGDVAAISVDDEVIFFGRVDDEIKISGQRIHPTEISAAIESLMIGHQVAVIPIKNESQYQIIAIIADDSIKAWQQHKKSHELKLALAEKLPSVQIPSLIFEMPKLPLTSAGKVDRKQLISKINERLNQAAIDNAKVQGHSEDNATNLSASLKKVIATWQDILGLPSIAPTDDFFVLGGTSLQLLQVATRLTSELNTYSSELGNHELAAIKNIEVTVSELFKYPKAVDLANHLDTRLANSDGSSDSNSDSNSGGNNDGSNHGSSQLEAFKPPKLLPELRHKFRPSAQVQKDDHVLLTGATGFVGIQLLQSIIANQGNCQVSCLIRAETIADAKQKIAAACKAQQLPDISQSQKITVVLGDLARKDWGLSNDELQTLAKPFTAIIHNGAITSVVRDYQSLEAINVDATQTAMKIAHLAGAPLHYISTIAIGDQNELPESFVELHQNLLDGYQQSKWASEYLLKERSQLSQPISVYRLPRVVGDSESGAINSKDLIWQIAAASTRAGVLPELDFSEPWLPANHAASFITACVIEGKTGVYNCVPDEFVSIKSVLTNIENISSLTFAPIAQWLNAISQSDHSEDQALHAFFRGLKGKAAVLPKISTQRFKQSAVPSALNAPKLDAYLRTASRQGIIAPTHAQRKHKGTQAQTDQSISSNLKTSMESA